MEQIQKQKKPTNKPIQDSELLLFVVKFKICGETYQHLMS